MFTITLVGAMIAILSSDLHKSSSKWDEYRESSEQYEVFCSDELANAYAVKLSNKQ